VAEAERKKEEVRKELRRRDTRHTGFEPQIVIIPASVSCKLGFDGSASPCSYSAIIPSIRDPQLETRA